MRPTNYKEIVKRTAQQLNLPEELVRDVIVYYYKDIRKSLSAFDCMRVFISGLGWFDVKFWRVKYRLADLKRMLKAYQPYNDLRSGPIKEDISRKIAQLENMTVMCEAEAIKKQNIKEKRRELEKEYYDRLAKQNENLGGNTQQLVPQPENRNDSQEAIGNLP